MNIILSYSDAIYTVIITSGIIMAVHLVAFVLSYIAWVFDHGYKLNVIIINNKCQRISYIDNYYEPWADGLMGCILCSLFIGIATWKGGRVV